MNNESLSQNLSLTPETIVDEIPEAVRDSQKIEEIIETPVQEKKWIWSLIGIAVLAGIITLGLQILSNFNQVNASSTETETETNNIQVTSSPEIENSIIESDKNPLSELPYKQATETELAYINPENDIRLEINAAKKFQQMLNAARNDGINLIALRGFKSQSELETLAKEATSLDNFSALSYGEYITGYAVDIGDKNAPATHQNLDFENTVAFEWLQNYAAYFSFEMIPSEPEKGVSYQPWHWRYVGDRRSLETFYKNQPDFVPETSELVEKNPESSR
ncbi:MAG: D-alanyl-D-alanine carboxypeptidase family protein [Trichodesmium sp.]